MDDMHSDYVDYEIARDQEGGLRDGRRTPSSGMLRFMAVAFAALIGGLLLLGLLFR